MRDFSSEYQSKKTTAAELASRVQSGWLIGMDSAASHTPFIMAEIAKRARNGELTGVKVQSLLDVYPMDMFADNSLFGRLQCESWFTGGGARKAVNGGYGDIIPNYYRDCPGHVRRLYEYGAFCASVSPMDKHGYFSLATTTSFSLAMIDKAQHIFLEVNDRQPRAVGGAQIHISQVDGFVEVSAPLPVLPPAHIDPVSETIGGLIAEQICDGACIQLGIGAIPDAVGAALKNKRDLGIHTELFTDSMVELLECGAANNSKKQIHRGQSVTTFAFGSQRIYDYIDDNPAMLGSTRNETGAERI